jgi:peptidoglycan hydrolase-like protein with peptidoglycan-binding domain
MGILTGIAVLGIGTYVVITQNTLQDPSAAIQSDTQSSSETTLEAAKDGEAQQNSERKIAAQQPSQQTKPADVKTTDPNYEKGFVLNTFYTEKCPFVTHSMVVGSSDATTDGQVSKLQDFLRLQGMFSKASSGYFDTETLAAVAKWQKYIGFANQIKNPGTVGPITQEHMNGQCAVRTYTFPKLGKFFITPNGTPTIKVPDGWEVEVKLDTPLSTTQGSGIKTRVSFVGSDRSHFHALDYQIYASKTSADHLDLMDELLKNYHVGDPSKKATAQNIEEYGLTYIDIAYEEPEEAGAKLKTRIFAIPDYTIVLSSLHSREQLADRELDVWYKTVFDSIVLPTSFFNEFPTGVPITQYVSKLNESMRKIDAMKTIPKGTPADFYLSTCYTFSHEMLIGSVDKDTGGQVSNLQKMLFEKYKVSPSTITGRYDDLTVLYVIKFQRDMGLEGLGGVGTSTREALGRCKPLP